MDIKEAVFGSFGLPTDVTCDMPKIMLLGKNEIYVENYLALAEYKKDTIRLITRLGMTEILGDCFEIRIMQQNNIAICGRIDSIRLI